MEDISSTENLQPLIDEIDNDLLPKKPLFLSRLFSPIRGNSLRLAVINTIICIISSSFFVFPLAYRTYGLLLGPLLLLVSSLANFLTCKFIYEASEFTGDDNYLQMIGHLLGDSVCRLAKVTFTLDYFSNYMIQLLLSWNILQYIFLYLGFISKEALINPETLEVDPYDPKVFNYRAAFIVVCLGLFTPVITGKNQEAMKLIMIGYLLAFLVFVGYLAVDLTDFYRHYRDAGEYKISLVAPFSIGHFKYLFIIFTAYYIQPSLMTMKSEIFNPSLRRVIKSARVAYIYLALLSVVCGLYCYLCLGDFHTTDVFVLRKSFEGKQREPIYMCLISILGFFSLLYIKFYHANMRTFLQFNFGTSGSNEYFYLVPWIFALGLTLVYPKIINFLGFNAVSVFVLDGYAFPILMKRKICKIKAEAKWKVWTCDFALLILIALSIFSFAALCTS